MTEVWKDISYAPGYQISNLGRVKSLPKQKKHVAKCTGLESYSSLKEKILTPVEDACGYVHYRLRVEGNYLLRKGHTLVAEAFLNYVPTYHRACQRC